MTDRERVLEAALKLMRDRDNVELMLDPLWAKRLATDVLADPINLRTALELSVATADDSYKA